MVSHVVLMNLRADLSPSERRDLVDVFEHALREIPTVRAVRVGRRVVHGAGYEASAPAPLFEFRPGGNLITPYYVVTKDGQKFLLSTIVDTEAAAPLMVVINWAAEVKR